MDLRTKICLWVIVLGMANFLAYTIGYTIVGGESVRGRLYKYENAAGEKEYKYFLDSGAQVTRTAFVYSGIHSISIWISVGAIMLAMLTLAKDRIADSLQSAAMRGRTLCTVLAVLIGICTAGLTFQFIHEFVEHFNHPLAGPPPESMMPSSPPHVPPLEPPTTSKPAT